MAPNIDILENQDGMTMAYRWPADTVCKRIDVDVEDRSCPVCACAMHVCDHRYHHLWTFEGPTQVVNRLVHCPEPSCESRGRTCSPEAAFSISMPRWCRGWEGFCWLGHRRFARHWSVPQLRLEWRDTHQIRLSDDAIERSMGLYQTMLAARQHDPERLVEGPYPWIPLAEPGYAPPLGEEVDVLSYPMGEELGLDITYTAGEVGSLRQNEYGVTLLQVSANVTHGSSGGPLFRRADCRVIGIVHGGVKHEIASGLNFAVSVEEIYRRFALGF